MIREEYIERLEILYDKAVEYQDHEAALKILNCIQQKGRIGDTIPVKRPK